MSDESSRPVGSMKSRDSLFVARDREKRELYEFGPFRLEPAERKLMRGNEIVVLTPKAFDTLVLLVRNSGHLLEKDELIRMLWPDSFVEEGNLSNNIFVLRKALGEDPPFIETVPKRGYRFIGAVRQLPSGEKALREQREFGSELSTDRRSAEHTVAGLVPSVSRSRRRLAALAGTLLAILAIGVALQRKAPALILNRQTS